MIMITDAVKILVPAAFTFLIGMLITPYISDFLYRHKFWKKTSVQKTLDGQVATISQQLHNDEVKKTPRMGGIVVWGSVLISTMLFWAFENKLSFLSRNQTWLPFFTLIATALIGLIDDYLVCRDTGGHIGGGLSLKKRLLAVALIGAIGAWWFFTKLEVSSILVPYIGTVNLGILFPVVFVFFMIGMYSGGIIDGIDGLAGGIFAIMFSAYGIISFYNNQIDLAALCMSIVGGLLVFLWFNIPPARFYLSETGTMALTTTLVVIAFLTEEVVVLPIIALPLIVTSASSLIQILSKKFRNGKKVFLVAPLHNHFQAKGWPPYKVTMRYWVVSLVLATIGIIVALTS
ncbi:MAG: phospho-N-acetylmuramoyl-pentapeptide-transferase, phospho-N-acetylmuramoyl-pentapeptide-transferase [Candidatus Parcubacteria bacterium]|jgi:phospho-N-acetylmuramoyl-pentapeptide-transferase